MKQKKGFIATSLIYSFFLVFLMLMASILVKNVNNRILLDALKKDIRNTLEEEEGFVIDTLQGNYAVGTILSYANENWLVLEDKTNSVVLMLVRSLNSLEISNAIAPSLDNLEYFGTCSVTGCQVRACRNYFGGQEYCYLYDGSLLHTKPSWNPSIDQIKNQNYGRTIVSTIVDSWITSHQGLKKVLTKDKLVEMTFHDGFQNSVGFIRLPKSSEVTSSMMSGIEHKPFHLVDSVGVSDETKVKLYDGTTVVSVPSFTAAYIYPVIEAKKG